MGPIELTIERLARERNTLARPLEESEIAGLVSSLRHRFLRHEDALDGSPASLSELDDLLLGMQDEVASLVRGKHDEKLTALVREIAAYFGHALLTIPDTEWRPYDRLRMCSVLVRGQFLAEKDGVVRSFPATLVPVGNIAATALDAIAVNAPPLLVHAYKQGLSKVIREAP